MTTTLTEQQPATAPSDRPAGVYPIVRPDDDTRFTFDLAHDVAYVLRLHGYPPIRSRKDLARLQQALHDVIHGTDDEVNA